MSSIRRLAAAQAYARNRAQQRTMNDVRLRQARQLSSEMEAMRREQKRSRIMGGIQSVIGLGTAVGGAFAQSPGMVGAGAGMFTSGLGQATGSQGVQSIAPLLAQTAGYASANLMDPAQASVPGLAGPAPLPRPTSGTPGGLRSSMPTR